MKKQFIVAGMLAAVLAMPLTACGGSSSSSSDTSSTTETTETTEAASDFDANALYAGEWMGSVEITGQTVYGSAGGFEQMVSVVFAEDGTVTVTPDPDHTDLLTDKGTWEGTEADVTLHLSNGDITLTVVDNATLTGKAADFGIADFEDIQFDFYG